MVDRNVENRPPAKVTHPQTKKFLEGIFIPDLPDPQIPLVPLDTSTLPKPDQYVLPEIRKDLVRLVAGVFNLEPDPKLATVDAPEHTGADLAITCYPLARNLRKPPEIIAREFVGKFSGLPTISGLEATNGYLNFTLNSSNLGKLVLNEVEKLGDKYGYQDVGNGNIVVIDSSSPNIAKFMSVGHLRSTVIGESLSKIYKANGYNIIRDNHLGDWGTQFGMLGRAYELWGDKSLESQQDPDSIQMLYELYVRMHKEIDGQKRINDSEESPLEQEGRAWFKRLEDGDPDAKKLLDWAMTHSLKEFQRVYDILGVSFEYMLGESAYVPMLPSVLKKLSELNIIHPDSKGGLSADLSPLNLPRLMVQKKDDTSLYASRDLATLAARTSWFDPEKIVYVVGGEQKEYFKQIFEVFHRWAGDEAPITEHVGFGMITLPEGKMSTRKGRVIFLENVLNEAISRAYDRIPSERELDDAQKQTLARQLGVGAVIYMDLGQGRDRDIKFDWTQALTLEGHSAPYIQYAHARAATIIEKAEKEGILAGNEEVVFNTPNERRLIKLIASYPESVKRAMEQNQPSIVAEHTYSTAAAFNQFYHSDRVLGVPNEAVRSSRLRLTNAAGQTLKNGLFLLGIESPTQL